LSRSVLSPLSSSSGAPEQRGLNTILTTPVRPSEMSLNPDALRLLAAPIEQILTCGGDTRLVLDPVSQLNGYGCRPFPRPEAFTFASSTATSISGRAYAAAAAARQGLLRDSIAQGFDRAFDAQMEAIRGELKLLFGLEGSGCEIVFSPSGTDAQLHALFVARAVLGTPLVSIIAAADETGSGSVFATSGRHFNPVTACGVAVAKGEPIAGMADGVESISVPLRAATGLLRADDEVDGEIRSTIARSIAAQKRVLLFAMDSSKFGLRSPSLDCLRSIHAAASQDVLVVIDAAQMRLGLSRLRRYVEQGFIVLITGSKFFTGAPFSGALILPPSVAARCRGLDQVPQGMRDYTHASDWPPAFAALRAALPTRSNIGQWARWVAAREEMRAYFAVPKAFREFALRQFAEVVPRLIAAESSCEALLLDEAAADTDDEEFAVRTIFPFFVRGNGRLLSQAQTTKLYRALNDDVAALLPATLPPMQRLLAARRCHIGQPVAVADGHGRVTGALRISAGARVASETWRDDALLAREALRAEFDQVRAILEKIRLLARYFEAIEPIYDHPGAASPQRVSAA
jgi:hypothetical protein